MKKPTYRTSETQTSPPPEVCGLPVNLPSVSKNAQTKYRTTGTQTVSWTSSVTQTVSWTSSETQTAESSLGYSWQNPHIVDNLETTTNVTNFEPSSLTTKEANEFFQADHYWYRVQLESPCSRTHSNTTNLLQVPKKSYTTEFPPAPNFGSSSSNSELQALKKESSKPMCSVKNDCPAMEKVAADSDKNVAKKKHRVTFDLTLNSNRASCSSDQITESTKTKSALEENIKTALKNPSSSFLDESEDVTDLKNLITRKCSLAYFVQMTPDDAVIAAERKKPDFMNRNKTRAAFKSKKSLVVQKRTFTSNEKLQDLSKKKVRFEKEANSAIETFPQHNKTSAKMESLYKNYSLYDSETDDANSASGFRHCNIEKSQRSLMCPKSKSSVSRYNDRRSNLEKKSISCHSLPSPATKGTIRKSSMQNSAMSQTVKCSKSTSGERLMKRKQFLENRQPKKCRNLEIWQKSASESRISDSSDSKLDMEKTGKLRSPFERTSKIPHTKTRFDAFMTALRDLILTTRKNKITRYVQASGETSGSLKKSNFQEFLFNKNLQEVATTSKHAEAQKSFNSELYLKRKSTTNVQSEIDTSKACKRESAGAELIYKACIHEKHFEDSTELLLDKIFNERCDNSDDFTQLQNKSSESIEKQLNQIKFLEKELQAARKENNSLNSKLTEAMCKKCAQGEADLEAWKLRLESYEQNLANELKACEAASKQIIEKQLQQIDLLQEQLKEANASKLSLLAEYAAREEQQALAKEVEVKKLLNNVVFEYNAYKEEMQEQLRNCELETNVLRQKYDAQNVFLYDIIEKIQNDKSALMHELQKFQNQERHIAELEEQLQRVEQDKLFAEASLQQLRQTTTKSNASHDQLMKAKQEIQMLRVVLQDLKMNAVAQQEVEKLQQSEIAHQHEIRRLQDENAAANADIKLLYDQLKQDRHVRELNSSVTLSLQKQASAYIDAIDFAYRECTKLTTAVNDLNVELNIKMHETESLRSILTAKIAEIEVLKHTTKLHEESRQRATSIISKTQLEIEHLTTENWELKNQQTNLSDE